MVNDEIVVDKNVLNKILEYITLIIQEEKINTKKH